VRKVGDDLTKPDYTGPQPAGSIPVQKLIEQLLIGKLDGLSGPQTAAFLAGWTSAIDLLRRVDVTMPDASDEIRRAVGELVRMLEAAQVEVVSDS
jgi:hypothetical protein